MDATNPGLRGTSCFFVEVTDTDGMLLKGRKV